MSKMLKKHGGRALALTAVSAASLMLAGCSLFGGEADVFSIEVGDCLNDASSSGEVETVPKVDCSEPHDSEAFATHDLADGDYPAQDAMFAEADAECEAAFDGYVGVSYDESTLAYSYYFPTEESWATGDREILCVLIEVDASGNAVQTTGSLKDSGK